MKTVNEWETQIRDVYEGKSRWCVVCADNRDVLPRLEDGCVDHVITDPPYEAEAHINGRRSPRRNGKTTNAGVRAVVDMPLSFAPITEDERKSVSLEFARLVSRWVINFSQIEGALKWQEALVASRKLVRRRIGVWIKPDAMPQFTGDRPGVGFESIVFTHRKGRSTWNGGGRTSVFIHNKNTPGGKHFHETQKPLPLMLELVELFTDPDDLVLDPFCGSSTTGVACLRLRRRYIGIEREPKYAAIARERMMAEENGLSLHDARAGQLPMFGESQTKKRAKKERAA